MDSVASWVGTSGERHIQDLQGVTDYIAMGHHRGQANRQRPHREASHVMLDLGRSHELRLHARISCMGQPMHSRLEFLEVRHTTLQATLGIRRKGCRILGILQEVFH
jgi:hypothetical protein